MEIKEKTLTSRGNGMACLLLFILLYLAATAMTIVGAIFVEKNAAFAVMLIIGAVWLCVGWLPFLGLKVLGPKEALVLTLFGKYIGTLRDEGFYCVNPFCAAVNPAARTKLSQSGDVDGNQAGGTSVRFSLQGQSAELGTPVSRKISLKIMTLNNSRQKINDCLGNPIEIGIAVMWQVSDTAKAVFSVDNYKEYLSLQCDTALHNIVRIYPYDIAQGSIHWPRNPDRAACAVRRESWRCVSATRSRNASPPPVLRS